MPPPGVAAAHSPRQSTLSFEPCLIRVAVPPQCPQKVHKLKPAARNVLELLRCGPGPYLWHQLMAVGGARYGARVGELRAAGYVILGPLGWTRPDGTRETRTVELGPGQAERYRLIEDESPAQPGEVA
jgi:hypothetical protein